MADTVTRRHGMNVLLCAPDGTRLRGDRDAVDLVGAALESQADLILIPVERLDVDFFRLSTGVAGEILQKFVNYRLRIAVVGDITGHLGTSGALRDFVRESNRGRQVWFAADLAELDARLERLTPG